MNWTLGILCGSLVSWMRWAVLPSRGDRRTGVASVAGGSGRRGSVCVIGRTVLGTLLHVRHRCTLFVDLSACFVVGLGAFMMGGASNIRQRSSKVVIVGVGPTLCSSLWATLCWSFIGVLGWGTHWKPSSGRIHAWHGLVRKAGPPGHNVLPDNFARTSVSTRRCFSAVIFFNVETTLLVNSCRWSFVDRNGTWQCWGNSSADPDIRYACAPGTK